MQMLESGRLVDPALSSIIPRWEWRIFEPAGGSFIARVAPAFGGEDAQRTSREIYIVSSASPNNVKIRAGQLEIKLLEQVSPSGLELWRPVVKRAFPISASDLTPVWNAWNVEPPPACAGDYTIDALLEHIVAPHASLRAVHITKTRVKFAVLGCSAERAALSIDGARWETVAIEDEEHDRVARARDSLGPNTPQPVSYPAMLRRIVAEKQPPTPSGDVL